MSDISYTSKLVIKDEIAHTNHEMTRQELQNGRYGELYLDLDTKSFDDYRSGRITKLPKDPAIRTNGYKQERVNAAINSTCGYI